MSKLRIFQNATIITLGVAIIMMSVGYAVYSTPVDITGTATSVNGAVTGSQTIKKQSWDVHFANVTTTDYTTIENVETPSLTEGNTALQFNVPVATGGTYEFTVDIINDGTFDAKLSNYILTSTLNEEEMTSTYGELTYSNDNLSYIVTNVDGSQIEANEIVEAGKSKTIKVLVKYNDIINVPVTGSYALTLSLAFTQA